MISNLHKRKIQLLLLVITLAFLAVIIALINWQLVNNDSYLAIAEERFREQEIPAVRGAILAQDNSSLAFSEPRYDIFIWKPELVEAEQEGKQTRVEFVKGLADVLEENEELINERISTGGDWIKIASAVAVDEKIQFQQLPDQAGLRFQYINRRFYPENNMAAHLVGFLGKNDNGEEIGVGGLEQYWHGSMAPFAGRSLAEYDIFGNPINFSDLEEVSAQPGITVKTSIDKNLQATLEKHLQDGFTLYQAKSASGIIMDPKTGQILAMANFPAYDPNEYFNVEDGDVFGNKTITTPYEIGSVAKVFTLAAAIDSGKLDWTETVLPDGHRGCEVITPGADPLASCSRSDIQCICTYDKHPVYDAIDVKSALVNSDNIAFTHIGEKMEYAEFSEYLSKFGIGKITGIDLAGESTGVIDAYEDWDYSDFAVYSYGHSYQITPLQAVTAIGAVANGGKRMQPYVVSELHHHDGKVEEFEPQVVEEVISEKSAAQVATLMQQVYLKNLVEDRYRDLADYTIAMKSGTALVPYRDKPGYSSEVNTTYVGFDNSDRKKFIMLVKLEEPQNGNLSFYNARMLWLDIFRDIKDYLGVPTTSS